MLDYSLITKSQRSNSYIENYNRRIKLKLSKFLFGKNKYKISWPLFLYFITHEEDETKKENYNIENSTEIKYVNMNFNDKNDINTINENDNSLEFEKDSEDIDTDINQISKKKFLIEIGLILEIIHVDMILFSFYMSLLSIIS